MSLLSFYPFWVFVRLQNSAWDFWGFQLFIGSGDFLEFSFNPEVFFVVFVYVPIRTSPSRKIQSTPFRRGAAKQDETPPSPRLFVLALLFCSLFPRPESLFRGFLFLVFFFVIQRFLLFFHTKTQQLQQLQIT